MNWRISVSLLTAVSAIFLLAGWKDKKKVKPRILVFTKTAGFYHTSIPAGRDAIIKLGRENGFDVDSTSSADVFSEKMIRKYRAVVFLNTTGNVLNEDQQQHFQRYIRDGGGFIGIHSATDTEYEWPWFGQLVGAYFNGHPKIQDAALDVVDQDHISTGHLPAEWRRKDEWYNFKQLNPNVKTLIRIDEDSYEGGTNGNEHPIAWYHALDGGRAFYTGLGHTEESYTEPLFLQHLLGGIKYAMGTGKK